MMISLKQVCYALDTLGLSKGRLECAISELRNLLGELDEVEVKGRENIDTMLGCMMAIDAIIGKDEENG